MIVKGVLGVTYCLRVFDKWVGILADVELSLSSSEQKRIATLKFSLVVRNPKGASV